MPSSNQSFLEDFLDSISSKVRSGVWGEGPQKLEVICVLKRPPSSVLVMYILHSTLSCIFLFHIFVTFLQRGQRRGGRPPPPHPRPRKPAPAPKQRTIRKQVSSAKIRLRITTRGQQHRTSREPASYNGLRGLSKRLLTSL